MIENNSIMNRFEPEFEVGKVYKHYKGNYYFVVGLAKHTETEELMVVYYPLYRANPELFTRPYDDFVEYLDKHKCHRFELHQFI